MPAQPSFDVVSKVDRQEVDNALRQAEKELGTRFDFRGTGASIAWAGEEAVSLSAQLAAARVSWNFFSILGVPPALGRSSAHTDCTEASCFLRAGARVRAGIDRVP